MFVKKTVDSIVASFNKTIADLRSHAEAMGEAAADHHRQAAQHSHDGERCLSERERAHNVARKLEQIVGA